MGDMDIVVGVTGYLIAFVVLMPMAGFGDVGFIKPGEGVISPGANQTSEQIPTQSFGAALVECLLTGGAIFGALDLLIEVPFVDCSRRTTTVFFQLVTDAFDFAKKIALFFFQMLFLQVPEIHPLAVLLFFHAPGALLAVVGIRMIRGVG